MGSIYVVYLYRSHRRLSRQSNIDRCPAQQQQQLRQKNSKFFVSTFFFFLCWANWFLIKIQINSFWIWPAISTIGTSFLCVWLFDWRVLLFRPSFVNLTYSFFISLCVCVFQCTVHSVCVCVFFFVKFRVSLVGCSWLGWTLTSSFRSLFFRFPTSTGFYFIPACVCVRIYPVLNRKSKKAPVCVYSPWTGEKETKIPERWIWFVLNEVDKISIRIFKNRKNQKDLSDRCRVIAEIDTRHHGSRRHIESP